MYSQTIIQVGNSNGMLIPSLIMKDLNLKRGQQVIVDTLPDSDGFIVKSKVNKTATQSKVSAEFNNWLQTFLEEDAELLDELASR